MKANLNSHKIEKETDDVKLNPGEIVLSPEELSLKLAASGRKRKLIQDATERENLREFDRAFAKYAKTRGIEENDFDAGENPDEFPEDFEDDEMTEKLLRDETPEFYEMNPADSCKISPRAEKINVAIFA